MFGRLALVASLMQLSLIDIVNIQFRAVAHECLHHYVDVVIFSTKGVRSALSWLGGGDYDGDTVILIWEPEIVEPFTNASTCRGDPPPGFIETNFARELRTTADYATKLSGLTSHEREQELQDALLYSIGASSAVGLYSNL